MEFHTEFDPYIRRCKGCGVHGVTRKDANDVMERQCFTAGGPGRFSWIRYEAPRDILHSDTFGRRVTAWPDPWPKRREPPDPRCRDTSLMRGNRHRLWPRFKLSEVVVFVDAKQTMHYYVRCRRTERTGASSLMISADSSWAKKP